MHGITPPPTPGTSPITRRAALLAAALAGLGGTSARIASAAAQTPETTPAAGWVAIRTYQLNADADRAALVALTEAQFVPLLRAQPGFLAFYVLEPDPLTWMAVNVWETEDAAIASGEVARGWVADNVAASIASGPESIEARLDVAAFRMGGPVATPES